MMTVYSFSEAATCARRMLLRGTLVLHAADWCHTFEVFYRCFFEMTNFEPCQKPADKHDEEALDDDDEICG